MGAIHDQEVVLVQVGVAVTVQVVDPVAQEAPLVLDRLLVDQAVVLVSQGEETKR